MSRELVWIHDLEGNQVDAIGHGFLDLWGDHRLNGPELLGFEILASNPKSFRLQEEIDLVHRGKRYFISDLKHVRVGNEVTIEVEASAIWYRLGHKAYPGSLLLLEALPSVGLESILEGTGWRVGTVDESATTFSMEQQDRSVLFLLRTWAKITGLHLSFQTSSRTVSLTTATGNESGMAFRYRRNLSGVERHVYPPEITRIFPYGSDGLTISGVNGGVPYVEDLTYYTGLGIDLDDPSPDGRTLREYYSKEEIWSDTSFIKDTDLRSAALTRLSASSSPQVSYEMEVIDLSALTDVPETARTGDVVSVYDPDIGGEVRPVITRYLQHWLEPFKNKIELSTILDESNDPNSASTRGSSSQEWRLFTGPVRGEYPVRNDGDYIVARIPLRFAGSGKAHFHLDLWMIGVGAGDAIVTVVDTAADPEEQQFRQVRVPYTDGETVRATLNWASEYISGSKSYSVRVTTEATGGAASDKGVDVSADNGSDDLETFFESSWWIKAVGAVQETPVMTNSIRFDYLTDNIQSWTVPDNVEEITVQAAGAGTYAGGDGCIVEFIMPVVPGTQLDIYAPQAPDVSGYSLGGWPGGGDGGQGSGAQGNAGGGYAAVIPAGQSLVDAWVVAGAGGGSGENGGLGGNGGFLVGEDATDAVGGNGYGRGGTQSAGGIGGYGISTGSGETGAFGQGGEGKGGGAFQEGGGGGGGGWYGGGGGDGNNSYSGGGGGGSSRIHPDIGAFDIQIQEGANGDHGWVEFSWEEPI